MFASAGALLIMSSCNNANSEKAESSMEAEIVASTDSSIAAVVDTADSVAMLILHSVNTNLAAERVMAILQGMNSTLTKMAILVSLKWGR